VGLRRGGRARGFTLVEVMVATVLLSMMIIGILAVMIGAYRVAAKARYADHARYVIKSMADQFVTQQYYDSNTGSTLPMFQITTDSGGNAAPVGTGMSWTNSDGSVGYNSGGPVPAYFYVLLGDNSGAPIVAQVTRQVWYVYPNSGQPTLVTQDAPAGYMLRADFSIQYTYLGVKLPAQTITAIRSIP
jgi:prepilin-type N-terminal cleavage/methylation domain-containing protein